MADFSALKTAIQNYIKQNGNEEITGEILQTILLSIVNTLGDSAIDDLITALNNEVANRQNADGSLEGAINQEGVLRSNADSTLQGNINAEAIARENADAALQAAIDLINSYIPAQTSSSNQLADKAFVNSSIATATATFRGSYNVVTDLELSYNATHAQIQAALATKMTELSITADNNDYAFVQIPTADATPTQIAKTEKYKYNGSAWAFEYVLNNSGFTAAQWAAINSGATLELIGKLSALPTNAELTTLLNSKEAVANKVTTITSNSTDTQYASAKAIWTTITAWLSGAMSWTAAQMKQARANLGFGNGDIDDEPIAESENLVKSGGVLDSIIKDGSAFDLSAYNNGTTYADLNAAITALNALPAAYKKGGMSMKFVRTSDNKYVQWRYMGTDVTGNPNPFLDTANWQGVDGVPTANSENLVKSGGVYNSISNLQRETEDNKEYTGIEILGSISTSYHTTGFIKPAYVWFNQHPTTIEGNVNCSFRNLEDCPYLQAGTYTFNKDYKGQQVFLYTNFSDLTSFTRITVNNNNEFTINSAGYLRFLFSYEDIISEDGVLLINTNTSDVVYNITIPRRTFNEKIQAQTEPRKQYKINATAVASKAWEQGELMGSLTIPAYHRLDFVSLRFVAGNCNIEIKDGTTTIESWNGVVATYEYDFLLLYNKDYPNGLTINIYSAIAQTKNFFLNAFYKGEKSVSDIVLSKRKPDMICASIYNGNTAPILKANDGIERYQLKSIFNATRAEQENEIVVAGNHVSGAGLFEVKAFDSNFIEKQFNPALNVVPTAGSYPYICRDRNRDIFWMVGDSLSDRGGYTTPNSLTYYSFAKEMVEKYGLLFSFCGNPTFGQTTAQQYGNLNTINTFIVYTSNISNALAGNVVLRSDEIKGIYIYIGTNDIVQQTNLQTFITNYNNLITLALTFTSSKIMVIVPSLCNKKANASDYCNAIKTICEENNIDYVDLSAVDALDSNEHGQSDVYYEAECIHFTQHAWEDIINPLCMAKFQEVFADTITDALLKAEY